MTPANPLPASTTATSHSGRPAAGPATARVPAARTDPGQVPAVEDTDVGRTPVIARTPDGALRVDGVRVVEGASGTAYLLHFRRPFGHARHYLGWAAPGHLAERLGEHAAGRGARLTQVVHAAGIGWTLARTWPGTRWRERSLKRQGGASRRCPVCGVRPRFPEPPPTRTRHAHADDGDGSGSRR